MTEATERPQTESHGREDLDLEEGLHADWVARSDGPRLGVENNLIQLRFRDSDGELTALNAAEMAEVLQGLVALTSDFAKAGLLGEVPSAEVLVRPTHEGSFVIDALVMLSELEQSHPEGFYTVVGGAGSLVTQGLRSMVKSIRAKVVGTSMVGDDMQLEWADGSVDLVPASVGRALMRMNRRKRTRTSLRKLMAPLGDDADVLEIRDGSASQSSEEIMEDEPDLVVERPDYRSVASGDDEPEVSEEEFETTARITNVDFRRNEKWRIATPEGNRTATIADKDFLEQVDEGLRIGKNDEFDVKIHEITTKRERRTNREWVVLEVIRHRRGGDDDVDQDGRSAPGGVEGA